MINFIRIHVTSIKNHEIHVLEIDHHVKISMSIILIINIMSNESNIANNPDNIKITSAEIGFKMQNKNEVSEYHVFQC